MVLLFGLDSLALTLHSHVTTLIDFCEVSQSVAAQQQMPGKPRLSVTSQISVVAAPFQLLEAGITRLCWWWCCQEAQPAAPQPAAHHASLLCWHSSLWWPAFPFWSLARAQLLRWWMRSWGIKEWGKALPCVSVCILRFAHHSGEIKCSFLVWYKTFRHFCWQCLQDIVVVPASLRRTLQACGKCVLFSILAKQILTKFGLLCVIFNYFRQFYHSVLGFREQH